MTAPLKQRRTPLVLRIDTSASANTFSQSDPPSPPRAPPPSPQRRKAITSTAIPLASNNTHPKAPPPSPYKASFLGRMLEDDLEFLELTGLSGSLDEFSQLMEMDKEFGGLFVDQSLSPTSGDGDGDDEEDDSVHSRWASTPALEEDDEFNEQEVQLSWSEIARLVDGSASNHVNPRANALPVTPTCNTSPPDFSWTPSPSPLSHKRKRSSGSDVEGTQAAVTLCAIKKQRCANADRVSTPLVIPTQDSLDINWLPIIEGFDPNATENFELLFEDLLGDPVAFEAGHCWTMP